MAKDGIECDVRSAPIKSLKRCVSQVENDYRDEEYPTSACINNINRCVFLFDNPNQLSIQHIDCMAKLVNPETIIIKQVLESSPEYDCIENFANSFYQLNTFYNYIISNQST